VWNSLPAEVRHTDSLHSFKRRLKSHFLACFNDWQCNALQVRFRAWTALNSLLSSYSLTYLQCRPKAESEALVWAARRNWRPDWNSGYKEDDGKYVMKNKRECECEIVSVWLHVRNPTLSIGAYLIRNDAASAFFWKDRPIRKRRKKRIAKQ